MKFAKFFVALFLSIPCTSAWSQGSLGSLTEAQACDMLASDPMDQERPVYAGRIPARINNPEDTIRVCGGAAAKFPDNLRLQHNLARAYSQNGARDAAIEKFNAAAKAGYAASMLALADFLLSDKDPARRAEGRDWLRKAREHWYPVANYALAKDLERGRGGPQDLIEAREEYTLAANGGFTDALVELGRMYGLGLGGPQDDAKARDFYRSAVSRGDVVAMNNLGHMLWQGEGGAADPQGARKLIEQAAAAGYAPAQNNLGVMQRDGVGGSKDVAAALQSFQAATARFPIAWMNIAALHLSGDLGDRGIDNAVLAYASAAKSGFALAAQINSLLDATERKQATRLACMVIALTLVDDRSGSQLIERLTARNDPLLADLGKTLGIISAPQLSQELQQHSALMKIAKP